MSDFFLLNDDGAEKFKAVITRKGNQYGYRMVAPGDVPVLLAD
jgi:hypothetical protein